MAVRMFKNEYYECITKLYYDDFLDESEFIVLSKRIKKREREYLSIKEKNEHERKVKLFTEAMGELERGNDNYERKT